MVNALDKKDPLFLSHGAEARTWIAIARHSPPLHSRTAQRHVAPHTYGDMTPLAHRTHGTPRVACSILSTRFLRETEIFDVVHNGYDLGNAGTA